VRVRRWRGLTLAMLALWGIAAVATLWQGMVPDIWSKAGLALAACYFVGLGVARARMPRG
jgi:phosphatidylcholine synthase